MYAPPKRACVAHAPGITKNAYGPDGRVIIRGASGSGQ